MTDFKRSSTLSLRRPCATASGATPPRRSAEPAAAAAVTATPDANRTLDSAALLQGRSHVSIMHNGQAYQLRATRLGKLILTK